jgi:hypothetical protein
LQGLGQLWCTVANPHLHLPRCINRGQEPASGFAGSLHFSCR